MILMNKSKEEFNWVLSSYQHIWSEFIFRVDFYFQKYKTQLCHLLWNDNAQTLILMTMGKILWHENGLELIWRWVVLSPPSPTANPVQVTIVY